MPGMMRFPAKQRATPRLGGPPLIPTQRLGGSPPISGIPQYPWADGELLYAEALNAAFAAAGGGGGYTIAALRAATTATLPFTECTVQSYAGTTQKGAGKFILVSGDTTSADNGGTIIVDASSRRWYRETAKDNAVNVCWFGAAGDNMTDDTTAFNNALAYIASIGGGKLYVPAAIYKISATLNYTSARLTIMGDGKQSVIAQTSLTADTFDFTGSDITLVDFKVTQPYNAATAGVMFKFLNCNNAKMTRIWADGAYDCVWFNGSSTVTTYRAAIHDCNFVNVIRNGVWFDQYFGGLGTISNLDLLAAPGQTSTGPRAGQGILIFAGDTFTFTDINIAGFYLGVNISSTAGGINYAANFLWTNVLSDSNGWSGLGHGWTFNGGASSTYVTRAFLSSCWSGGMGGNGFNILNATHIALANCIIIGSGFCGALIANPCTDISFVGCHIYWNSTAAPNTYDGIRTTGVVTDWSVIGCFIKPTGYWGTQPPDGTQNTQRYAVCIATAASDRYIITNNQIDGNQAATAISDGGTGSAKVITNNIGA